MSALDLSASVPPILVSWPATLPGEVADVSEHQPAGKINEETDQAIIHTVKRV
jgi:hypothetical protein